MNQILVTEKVIMTPDFKRKKKLYQINFFLSSLLAVVLFSYGIYSEYDRNKSEEVSQDILLGMQQEEMDETTISVEEDVLVVKALSDTMTEDVESIVNVTDLLGRQQSTMVESIAPDGKSYYTESVLKIPRLGIEYPVLSDTSDELLKISLNRLWGPKPNEIGNYVIVGHNYKNGKMFGKLPGIQIGDICEVTDLLGRTVPYRVYTTYVVEPTDVSCTSQMTNGKKEITLITCVNGGKQRLVVKAELV